MDFEKIPEQIEVLNKPIDGLTYVLDKGSNLLSNLSIIEIVLLLTTVALLVAMVLIMKKNTYNPLKED